MHMILLCLLFFMVSAPALSSHIIAALTLRVTYFLRRQKPAYLRSLAYMCIAVRRFRYATLQLSIHSTCIDMSVTCVLCTMATLCGGFGQFRHEPRKLRWVKINWWYVSANNERKRHSEIMSISCGGHYLFIRYNYIFPIYCRNIFRQLITKYEEIQKMPRLSDCMFLS